MSFVIQHETSIKNLENLIELAKYPTSFRDLTQDQRTLRLVHDSGHEVEVVVGVQTHSFKPRGAKALRVFLESPVSRIGVNLYSPRKGIAEVGLDIRATAALMPQLVAV